MISKLDRYIIVNYIKSFILGMMMFFLIFLLAESINITGWIMDGKFKFHDAIKYLRYGIPEIVTNTAPLGVLLGSLFKSSFISSNNFIFDKFWNILAKLQLLGKSKC